MVHFSLFQNLKSQIMTTNLWVKHVSILYHESNRGCVSACLQLTPAGLVPWTEMCIVHFEVIPKSHALRQNTKTANYVNTAVFTSLYAGYLFAN